MAKIIKPQAIAMLEYLGVPYRNQPKPVGEKLHLIDKYKAIEPDKYEEAYSICVLHRIPEKLKGNAEAVAANKIGELIDGVWDGTNNRLELNAKELTRKAVGHVHESYDRKLQGAREELMGYAKNAIDKAAEKYITHRVKVGKQKAVRLDAVLPEYFDTLLALAQQRKNILLVGPAGAGKTHTAELLAMALELPFSSQSCSAGVSESVFTGWLLPTGKSGTFTHNASAFLEAYENGGVFLLDEIDRADPNVLTFLNQALANNSFYLPQRFDNPQVVKHPDFIAIAAGNTFGGGADSIYHSANALDGSTLDRFRMGTIYVDYSEKVEEELVNPTILEWGRKVREVINQHKMRRIMSTRVLRDATDMMEHQDWTLELIEQTYFADWSPEEVALYKRSA